MTDSANEVPAAVSPATSQAEEKHLFCAHVGQVSLLWAYTLIVIVLIALAFVNRQVPNHAASIGIYLVSLSLAGWGLYRMIGAWLHTYAVSTDVLKEKQGIFNVRTDLLEIYRIKDVTSYEPLHYRLFGAGNIVIESSDRTTPVMTLKALPEPNWVAKTLREAAENARVRKGVREID